MQSCIFDQFLIEFVRDFNNKNILKQISDIFIDIESKPIGTASLAQCHKAVLKNGQVVAVKIQHPSVKKNSHADIVTMMVKILFIIPPNDSYTIKIYLLDVGFLLRKSADSCSLL